MERTIKMTEKEALKTLHHFQKWRRGAKIEMPDPKQIGQALDVAIRVLRTKSKKHEDI